MKTFAIVYRGMLEKDKTKWDIYSGYTLFSDALHDVMTVYQYKGMLLEHGWWIYEVQEDGTMIKLGHDGNPIVDA
jgi:hypothetical protein